MQVSPRRAQALIRRRETPGDQPAFAFAYPRCRWPSNPHRPHPKKVAGLPVDGTDEVKQTNEIGTAIALLDDLEIAGKTVTADALLNFPFVGQAFAIERLRIDKKTGETSTEIVYGLNDHNPHSADPARLLAFNRDHWGVEAHHYMLDWNWGEDRCTIRTGHGPENITRLRRFATGLIQSKSTDSVVATIDKLARSVRRVFDYLRMTKNSNPRTRTHQRGHAG